MVSVGFALNTQIPVKALNVYAVCSVFTLIAGNVTGSIASALNSQIMVKTLNLIVLHSVFRVAFNHYLSFAINKFFIYLTQGRRSDGHGQASHSRHSIG